MHTVVICEPDPVLARRVREVLEADGMRVLTAGSNEEALLFVAESAPDLLVLDVEFGGLDLLARRFSSTRDTPVIMMGAAVPKQTVSHGWDLGVDVWISKNADALERLPVEICIFARRIFASQAAA